MERAWTAALGLNVPSVGENLLQDLGVVLRKATATAITTQGTGIEARIYQATSDLTTGTLAIVDDGTITTVNTAVDPAVTTTAVMDWSDRLILGWFRGLGGATEYPGGANDYLFDAGTLHNFYGYTGLGALNGASGQVSPGNPPVRAAGTSWACLIDTNLWLYYDAADGKLKVYNDTGSTLRTPALILFASGQTGAR